MSESRLGALIDGRALPDDEARALWVEFSAHMSGHRGDTAGFAHTKGWHTALPEHRDGRAVLVVWTTAQKAMDAAELEHAARLTAARRASAAGKKQGKKRGGGPKRRR
jgi:hypothetical protein